MILVTLGTQDKSFVRLLKMLEECLVDLKMDEEVIVQAGYTQYHSDRMKIFDYIDMKEFDELIQKADLIITHGGVGTIVTSLKLNKKIIACARLQEYGEHHNDHQCQIIDSFTEKGYILSCNNVDEMKQALLTYKNFIPKPFESNHSKFLDLIRKEINA